MVKNDWIECDGKWYYCENDGKIAKSKWLEDTYYVDENGQMLKNTITPDGYFVGEDGKYIDLKSTGIANEQKTTNKPNVASSTRNSLSEIYNAVKTNPESAASVSWGNPKEDTKVSGPFKKFGCPHGYYLDAKFDSNGRLWLFDAVSRGGGYVDILISLSNYESYWINDYSGSTKNDQTISQSVADEILNQWWSLQDSYTR